MAKKTRKKATQTAPARTAAQRAGDAKRAAIKESKREGDKAAAARIVQLAQRVVEVSLGQTDRKAEGDPYFDVPTRALSTTRFNEKRRRLEMGDAPQRRNFFNASQARKFMQSMLLASGCKDLIEEGKTLSLRGMYYRSLHSIPGTKEKTFDDQTESDAVLEDLEVSLGAMREELHVFAKKRGTMVGNITITDNGDEIDCRRMGSGGYAIPSICEPDVIQFGKCEAKFVLHVEKDTVWSRFNEDR